MKKVLLCLLVAICSFAGGFVAQQLPMAFADRGQKEEVGECFFAAKKVIECDELRAKSITLAIPGETRKVIMLVDKSCAGLWVYGEDGRLSAMADHKNQAFIGVYHNWREGNPGLNACLGATKDDAFIQLIDPKTAKVRHIDAWPDGKR